MTVTLQDISALWGLPIQGLPVGGISDPRMSTRLMPDSKSCWERSQIYEIMVAIKGAARSIVCLGKSGYRAFGHAMLNLVSLCIESHGHEAELVTMLRDAREKIDWRRVSPDEPDAPPVMASEMPPEPSEQPEWDYHHWVLGISGWHAFLDEHGRPIHPQGPAYMPPPPEPHEQHESPNIQPYDQWDTAAYPRPPYSVRAHDWEASGSGTQHDYASQLADSMFHTPRHRQLLMRPRIHGV